MASKKGGQAGKAPLVSAAVRVLSILESLADRRSAGIEELSREVGLAKPTVYRFLLTLQELGYVRRDENERWAVTLRLFNVGSRALDHLDLHTAARPVAEALAADLGEAVHVGVLEGDSAVYIIKIESKYTIRMYSRVGRRIPLYCTAIGKVLLAWSGAEERKAALAGVRLVAMTPRTLKSKADLDAELRKVREQGYAFDDEEHEEGIRCIGAPIFDFAGEPIAAVSASWPRFRYDLKREKEWVAKVTEAAARVSSILGYMPGDGKGRTQRASSTLAADDGKEPT
jgi:IclR family KDG regulon transcriptional repressor